MIPNVARGNVLAALQVIRGAGVEAHRASSRFCLVERGQHFPPKYVVSLAVEQARGRPLAPHEFSGGAETNRLLIALGFLVAKCDCGGAAGRSNREVHIHDKSGGASRDRAQARSFMIGRVVVQGRPVDGATSPRDMLLDVLNNQWPQQSLAKFLITPGGFVSEEYAGAWPKNLGWDSTPAALVPLIEAAGDLVKRVVNRRVLTAAAGKAEVLTLGVDLRAPSGAEHVELVAIVDVVSGQVVRWTGKSYPTGYQEHSLLHVAALSSHLLRVAGERVLVLGCHDLNMFSPRAHANQDPEGQRRLRCDSMREMVDRFRPTVVLQHPHSTDTPRIWRMPWLSFLGEAPDVKAWASGIGYYNGRGNARRAPLKVVLEQTHGGQEVLDLKVRVADFA